MHVVSCLFDQLIGIGVEVDSIHPSNMRARYKVPQMSDHSIDHEHFAVLVEIESPGVGHTVHDGFHSIAYGMIAPDTGIDLYPLRVRIARSTNTAGGLYPVPGIQPTVWPPLQSIGRRVPYDVVI